MFTIRHRETDGHETLIQSERVSTQPFHGVASPHEVQAVFYELKDGTTMMIESGTVFVMNDGGKTVAIYNLPCLFKPPEVPSEPVNTVSPS